MTWNQSTMYEQRVRFVLEVQQATFSFTESCRRYNISRTAGYTWWDRFVEFGFEGLHDRSHRPIHCPHATPEPIELRIVELRLQYGWGSRKIRKLIVGEFGSAPARRTIDRILERHDLITKKRDRPAKPGHPGKPFTPMDAPNAVWTVDFKGQFKMRNGRYCYPLTIQDGFSRYLLECQGLHSTSIELAKPIFIKAFREFGLPAVIRSDNGTPFASIALARLSRLSVWWIRLGIWPETIEPGKPQQNGRHERMHRTLKREATRPPRANLSAQQRHFNLFRQTFNNVRPHEALDDETPASVYTASATPYPETLPPLLYPDHFEVRKVSSNGGIRWHSRWVNISSVLASELIGLEPIGPNLWQVYFGPLTLGWFDEESLTLTDYFGNKSRNPIC
jgi:putative transposase